MEKWIKKGDGMTAKRFTITQDFEEHHRQIRDNGHIIMGCFVEPQAEVIVNLLNALHEENEQLKQSISDWRGSYDGLYEDVTRLEKENEQLKQIIYEDESQIIGEWSSHIQEDMKKLNKAYESDDINDLIRFCKEG